MTGSARDSLGVFVMSVDDNGPAAKAGIEEGARIASINGVDVRGHARGDDDDYVLRTSNVNRLEREVSRLKPGDDVELRVYFNGQSRNVKVKAGRMSDLPRHGRTITIMGGDNFMPPTDDQLRSLAARTWTSHAARDRFDAGRVGDWTPVWKDELVAGPAASS